MSASSSSSSRWVRRLAAVIPCATLPLIFVGGLVTTTDAGMAVEDWPSTWGYNLFLYPWQTWIAAPWDLFVEHGHRLFAAGLGMLCIALCVLTWLTKCSTAIRMVSTLMLLLVCGQGVLGGLRVLFDARTLAMVHGCTGPLVFALSMVQWELMSCSAANRDSAIGYCRTNLVLAIIFTITAYLQLVAGAQLRHGIDWLSTAGFGTAVQVHLFGAGLIVALTIVLATRLIAGEARAVGGMSLTIIGAVLCQIILGFATWLVNYGWPWGYDDQPAWLAAIFPPALQARSFQQTLITTAHVAVGSLILGIAARMAFRLSRVAVKAAETKSANHNSVDASSISRQNRTVQLSAEVAV